VSRMLRPLACLVAAVLAWGCGAGGGGGTDTRSERRVAQDLASVRPSPVTAARTSEPGAFAADYLRGTHFTTLVVEVDHPQSRPPTPQVLALLEQRLEEHCDKADVLVFADDAIPDGRFPDTLDVEDVQDIEDEFRDTFSDEPSGRAAMYLLYTLGRSADDEEDAAVLGIAHRGGSVALFVENADLLSDALFTPIDFEAHGSVHEAGHLLGLVDGGTPMVVDHEDEEHPFHTVDEDDVMFWSFGGDPTGPHFGHPAFAQFGPYTTQDMEAFGGR